MTRATSDIVIAGNTIHNVNHGIGIDGTATAEIVDNIISDVSMLATIWDGRVQRASMDRW